MHTHLRDGVVDDARVVFALVVGIRSGGGVCVVRRREAENGKIVEAAGLEKERRRHT